MTALTDAPLVRYGVNHTPIDDGYWTPWHVADERLRDADALAESQAAEIAELRTELNSRIDEGQAYANITEGAILPRLRSAESSRDALVAEVNGLRTTLIEARSYVALVPGAEGFRVMLSRIDAVLAASPEPAP